MPGACHWTELGFERASGLRVCEVSVFLNIYCLEHWGTWVCWGLRMRLGAVSRQQLTRSLRISLARRGLTFVSVHDCFWTHAADIPVMNEVFPVSTLRDPTSLYHG